MTPVGIKDLLLATRLDRDQVTQLLTPYGFKDPVKADANLQAVAHDPSERRVLADTLEELRFNVREAVECFYGDDAVRTIYEPTGKRR